MADFITNNPTLKLGPLIALASLGAGAWGGIFAGVTFMAGLLKMAFSDAEPLTLAIRLAIEGKIVGTLDSAFQTDTLDFYLPGRFSALEAFQHEGLSPDRSNVDRVIPRYDRSLGHLGFYSDPSLLEFPVLRLDDEQHTSPGPYQSVSTQDGTAYIPTARSRLEPYGWRTLHLFPAIEQPRFPYCETFFERWTLGFYDTPWPLPLFGSGYVEKIDAQGNPTIFSDPADALGALQGLIGWVEVAGHWGVQPETNSWADVQPGPIQSGRFYADLGLRIYQFAAMPRMGVRDSLMSPTAFVGTVSHPRIDPATGQLMFTLTGPNNEHPQSWYRQSVLEVSVSWALFGAMSSPICPDRLPLRGSNLNWWRDPTDPRQDATARAIARWRVIPQMLPIIYNPYAEIVPMTPSVTDPAPHRLPENPLQRWGDLPRPYPGDLHEGGRSLSGFEWEHDRSWSKHVTPEPDDPAFPTSRETTWGEPALFVKVFDEAARHPFSDRSPWTLSKSGDWAQTVYVPEEGERPPGDSPTVSGGYTLSIVPRPDLVPTTIEEYEPIWGETYTRGLQEYMMADPSHENQNPPAHMWPYAQGISYAPSPPLSLYSTTSGPGKPVHFRPFDPANPFPLSNIVYYWNVAYFYYGRTRKTVTADSRIVYPRLRRSELLRSPVTISVTRHVVEGETLRSFVAETDQHLKVKSLMLID